MLVYADRYQEIKFLGKGVTGEVVLAKDIKTGLNYALKLLRTTLGKVKKSAIEDFKDEFETLKKLNHPYIAKVFDSGYDSETNRFFIATEFVDGQDLFAFTENQSLETIESLFVQALRAFNYLHSQSIFHLDIKPQNLLVTRLENGGCQIKVIDFGFANFYRRKKSDPDHKIIVGTAAYTSPEVIQGIEPSEQSDLYSLACAFYKAFTRELPFLGTEAQEIHQKHLNVRPLLLSEHNELIPSYLNEIFQRMLEKDPLNRFESAQAVIEELNIRSGKLYPIETEETMMSYIPEQGRLIGRDEQIKVFYDFFEDRVKRSAFKLKNYLIIKGAQGCGKSRFINECKAIIQKSFIPIVSWDESGEMQDEDFPEKGVILGDDVDISLDDLEYMDLMFGDQSILTVLAVSDLEFPSDPECTIILESFDKELTKTFLETSTGLSHLPDPIVDIVFKHTQGNPLYLTEYMRALFKKGFFRDSHGGWTEQILQDLGSELESMVTHDFISTSLKEKLGQLQLKEDQQQILDMMALTGKPTLADLEEITNGEYIEDQLEFFVQKGILTTDPDFRYVFSNPIYKEIIVQNMDFEFKAEYCDSIAYFLESQNADQEKVLYFKGLGSDPDSYECLFELAGLHIQSLDHKAAQKIYTEIIDKPGVPESKVLKAALHLAELFTEEMKFEKALESLKKIGDQVEELSKWDQILFFELYGATYRNLGAIEKAQDSYKRALELCSSDFLPLQVRVENQQARIHFELGQLDLALSELLKSWDIWSKQLTEEEKVVAIKSDLDVVLYAQGKYSEAIEYLDQFFKVIEGKPYHPQYPILLIKLARCHTRLDHLKEGETFLIKALGVFKKKRLTTWLYIVYNDLGSLYCHQKNYQKALESYLHAFQLAKKSANSNHSVFTAYNVAQMHLYLQNYREAKKFHGYVIKQVENKNYKDDFHFGYHYFYSLIGMAHTLRCMDQRKDSKYFLEQAEHLFSELSFLGSLEIYLLFEKSYHLRLESKEEELKLLLDRLEDLKNEEGFDLVSYENWSERFYADPDFVS